MSEIRNIPCKFWILGADEKGAIAEKCEKGRKEFETHSCAICAGYEVDPTYKELMVLILEKEKK